MNRKKRTLSRVAGDREFMNRILAKDQARHAGDGLMGLIATHGRDVKPLLKKKNQFT